VRVRIDQKILKIQKHLRKVRVEEEKQGSPGESEGEL